MNQQLDIFLHSRDTMLRNDLLQALLDQQAERAEQAQQALLAEYPDDEAAADLAMLVHALKQRRSPPWVDAQQVALARLRLVQHIEPAARRRLGATASAAWQAERWCELAQRAAAWPFGAEHSDDHAAPLWLRGGQWQAAADAVASIDSWRRIPAPLAWMAEARLRLLGLLAAWPLLTELAWLSPRRLHAVLAGFPDARLQRWRQRFDAEFEPDGAAPAEGQHAPDLAARSSAMAIMAAGPSAGAEADEGGASDLAWFPAWLLTDQPDLAAHLAKAQPGHGRPPEQALRLMVALLLLERQGRPRDVIERRKALRELHPGLYAAYMKSR